MEVSESVLETQNYGNQVNCIKRYLVPLVPADASQLSSCFRLRVAMII